MGTAIVLLTAGLLAFAASRPPACRPAALFCLAWYGIAIVPVLPLRDHRMDLSEFAATADGSELPRRVDAADPLESYLLGPEWYPADGNHRWMGRRATLRIGGRVERGQRLWIPAPGPMRHPPN